MVRLTHALAPSRTVVRAIVGTASAFALVTASMGGSNASPGTKLNAAKDRLAALTDQIASEEAQARTLQDQLASIDARVRDASSRMVGIDAELASTRRELAAAAAQADRLQTKLDAMARMLFIQGGGSVEEAVLGPLLASSSMADLGDLLTYAQVVGQSNVDLATRVANVQAELAMKTSDLKRLRIQQRQLVAQLSAERASEVGALADQRTVLGDLERTKTQILSLITHLRAQVRAQALAEVGTAFQGAGHISYGAWAGSFLGTIGVSGCHSNEVVLVAWQYSEFTQAAWNPLADTLPMPGSTDFNSVGVQNYLSLDQGLLAVRTTLANGAGLGYGAIVSGLAGCADPMSTARAINASAWCRGCAGGEYVLGVIAKVEANYDLYARL